MSRSEPSSTLVDHLCRLASERPHDRALIVVGAYDERLFDYATLDRRVRALASELQGRFSTGERALLLLDNDEHYVVAFFACLYAGLIAVPVFPPESAKPQHLARLRAIAADSQAACVLTSSAILGVIADGEAFGDTALMAVDAVDETSAEHWTPYWPGEHDIAFLQYTSGSTATPKGVMVSHANLMANERAIEAGFSIEDDDVFVSWLPLYHDMGLIGGLLQPIHRGIPVVLMSPAFFLQRPFRWLEAISRHRGTVSGGPDFAYRLCLERVRDGQLAELDLSSWRVAFSGAEPVRHDTLSAFLERFAPAGFAAEAASPCYGLAEATLLVSCNLRDSGVVARGFEASSLAKGEARPAGDGKVLVGCGQAAFGHRIEIVDPQTQAVLPGGRVGDIWVSGPSVARGYWQRDEESAATFVERDGRRWLRTGDLGFLHDGQLYIAGRIKDVIILRGHNLYPQDIEAAIEAEVEAVRKGRVAAFAVTKRDGDEGIGVAAEVSRGMQKLVPAEALVAALGEAVSGLCHEPVAVTVLLNPGGLPKTSSGKLQRGACRQGWQAGTLDAYALHEQGRFVQGAPSAAVASEAPRDVVEKAVAELWQAVLEDAAPQPPARDAHFFASGGNSLAAVRLASRLSERWQTDVPLRAVFEHPVLHRLAAEVQRLRERGGAARPALAALPDDQRAAPLPLSYAQQRQWFLWQLEPQGTAYHISGILRLSGRLDGEALQGAFDSLVARHEALRTRFRPGDDGVPMQRIMAPEPFALARVDLRGTPDSEVQRHIRDVSDRPFDLAQGPLVRGALLKVGDEAHVLVVVAHHIIADGASMQVLIDELATCYLAHTRGEAPCLPNLAVQYADYAVWQRDWLEAGEGGRQLAYWRDRLGSDHPVLELPTDHPRRTSSAHQAGHQAFELPPELLEALRALAARRGTSLFTVLLAGFQALLQRHSGQRDIRVGVPVANRPRLETQRVIGFFVNTLVLRGSLHGRLSLDELLTQCQAATVGALAHQDLPFEQLVEALQPARSLAHNPLFQVMFNYRQEDVRALNALPGLTVSDADLYQRQAQFELTLEARERSDGQLKLAMIYAAELFEPDTIARLAEHFRVLLQALATSPAQALGDVALLGADERAWLERWGLGPGGVADAEPVHRQVERRVAEHPEAEALIFGTQRLSYAELNRRANHLAHHLIGLGVTPETPVGIAVERSIESVVGLLGILKAGGVYVPLDPDHPRGRLAHMVADSGIELLLTQRSLAASLAVDETLAVIELERLTAAQGADHDPTPAVHGDHLAYVLYTSGSTGRPKGIAMRHRAVAELMAWQQDHLPGAYRTLMFASPCFDVGFQEVMSTLAAGGSLVQTAGEDRYDVSRLVARVAEQSVQRLYLPYAVLQGFAETATTTATRLPRLIQLITAGEQLKLTPTLVEWRRREPQCRLINQYGPTETHVVSHHEVTDDDAELPPIGRPIGGTRLLVLDADLAPVPPGVSGELYVGGEALARGYLDRPGQTAERFIADPFDARGGRLYRTGDRARWRSDGRLEYQGRLDHQVKVRGFRVELGEIEAQLLAQSEVREAVVIPQEGERGVGLVAYVSGTDAGTPDAATLRERLGATLPDYMIPAAIVALDVLPLNANGKLDRRALPAPEPASERPHEAPRGDTEIALAQAWSEVLGVESPGRHDHFFELGGHSLLAVQVATRLRAATGLYLPIRLLFAHPTLGDLAARIDAAPTADQASPGSAPHPVPRRETMPLSPLQKRLWLVDRLATLSTDGGQSAYNMAAALRLEGRLEPALLEKTLNTLVERHEVLRTVYAEDDRGDPVAIIAPRQAIELPRVDVQGLTDAQRETRIQELLAEHAGAPFDLSAGPLLRARLARLSPQRHVLFLAIHHIAFDGWSVAVFVREFVAIYRALQAGRPIALPPLPLQYADYADWHARRLAGEAFARHADFWRRYLDDAPRLSTLPTDTGRPRVMSHAGDSLSLSLSPELTRALNRLARARGVTLFTLLLASFLMLMHRCTGQRDLVVGTDVAGRPHPDLEALIGFFVNVIPLRSRLADDRSAFDGWLERLQGDVLDAFEHQDVPFDQIVESLGTPRERNRNPLIQTLFVLQNTPTERFSIPGLEVSLVPQSRKESKFDLAVFVDEGDAGMSAEWVYATALYRRDTMERLSQAWQALLQQIVEAPDQPMAAFQVPTLKEDSMPEKKTTKLDKLGKLTARTRQAKLARSTAPVRTRFLEEGRRFPIVIEPTDDGLDALAWAASQRDDIERTLRRHGGILFRHFDIDTPQAFEAFAEAIHPGLYGNYGDLPKKEGGRNIYRSTPYPERQMILYHNESSHLECWPRKQLFFCERPSPVGGATPIVDCREMLQRLPADIVEAFERKGLLYVRTFTRNLDVSWRDFFRTDSRREVEARLERAGIDWHWFGDDELQTRTRCPAVVTHPLTGERVFFNQVQLHHVSCLDAEVRRDLLELVGAERLPRNVYYGDGSVIDDEVMQRVGGAYEACAVRFDWRQGDVVMLDNMLAAHARDPYQGPRKIVVAMGDIYQRSDLAVDAGPTAGAEPVAQ
ncbi:amino acid adenylation domain-containing protein [Halomonas sp. THAF12]|uniref:amino acid adenylation domain-containing protein n=1 Tax=Halomonas sp. B23F22_10 TaxID=3459515 RepID=UPI00373F3181